MRQWWHTTRDSRTRSMSWKDNGEKVAKNKLDYGDETKCNGAMDKCNAKFLACLFMHGADRKLHEKCINELNNVHLSGSD